MILLSHNILYNTVYYTVVEEEKYKRQNMQCWQKLEHRSLFLHYAQRGAFTHVPLSQKKDRAGFAENL